MLTNSFWVMDYVLLQVEGECIDGDELRISLPAEEVISKLVVSKRDDESNHLGLFRLLA